MYLINTRKIFADLIIWVAIYHTMVLCKFFLRLDIYQLESKYRQKQDHKISERKFNCAKKSQLTFHRSFKMWRTIGRADYKEAFYGAKINSVKWLIAPCGASKDEISEVMHSTQRGIFSTQNEFIWICFVVNVSITHCISVRSIVQRADNNEFFEIFILRRAYWVSISLQLFAEGISTRRPKNVNYGMLHSRKRIWITWNR